MRQLGNLPGEPEARRFAAWLVAQRIDAHAEEEAGRWVVWVRDEDKLPEAREALAHFRENPNDPKYQDAEQSAQAILRDEEARRRQAQGNVVEMRNRWGKGMPGMAGVKRRAPLIWTLIGLSALVALLAYNDTIDREHKTGKDGVLYSNLVFVERAAAVTPDGQLDVWANVRRGQVWRLITPIFIHFDLMHIIFNVFAFYSFGSMIEDRRGTLFTLLLILALAILSNVAQALQTGLHREIPSFGGLSGVVYGLFGYVYIKARYDSRERYFLSPGTTFMVMLWFVLCILRHIPPFESMLGAIPRIANTAHAVGLLAGAAIAYVPLMLRKPA